jgi:hypothetical protein
MRWILIVALSLVLGLAGNASAACSTTTYDFNGRIVVCTTCCFGTNCTTTCS